jgi:prepilin-type N-terminal cleavage/methylation domain-containing protein
VHNILKWLDLDTKSQYMYSLVKPVRGEKQVGGNEIYRTGRGGFTLLELTLVIAILALMAGLVIPMVGDTSHESKQTIGLASVASCRDGLLGNGAAPGLYSDVRYTSVLQANPLILRAAHLLEAREFAGVLYDPSTRKGWRGPYVRGGNVQNTVSNGSQLFPLASHIRFNGDASFAARGFFPSFPTDLPNGYGIPGEAAIGDAWGNPIVLQIPDESDFSSLPADERTAARWRFARMVSAGPNGVLDTTQNISVLGPVYLKALAGRQSDGSVLGRGDDIILFLNRADVYEP